MYIPIGGNQLYCALCMVTVWVMEAAESFNAETKKKTAVAGALYAM